MTIRQRNDVTTIGAIPETMRAVVYERYGEPEVLELRDLPVPSVGDGEVLIRVEASSVNPYDWHFMTGRPYIARLLGPVSGFGLRRPRRTRSGFDVAGVVETVGKGVERLSPGDEVFGWQDGAFSEYLVADESQFVPKPKNLSFIEAASVPMAGLTALLAVRDHGQVEPGQKVLVNSGSGGVGTFAVQLAKWMGAEVAAVASSRNVEMVRSLGADRVFDYTTEDFTRSGEEYDVLIDAAVSRALSECRKVLTPDGTHVVFGDTGGHWLGGFSRVIHAMAISPFVSQRMRNFTVSPTTEDLELLRDLIESGEVRPIIDRVYPMDEIVAGMAYVLDGHARAKVAVSVGSNAERA